MADFPIGIWAARFDGERQVTKWHLIDSDIAEDVLTRCGRRIAQRSKRGVLLIDANPTDRCRQCSPRGDLND